MSDRVSESAVAHSSVAHSSPGLAMPAARVARPAGLTRTWAYGDGSGAGVRVCLIDGGVHPGRLSRVAALRVERQRVDSDRVVIPATAGATPDPAADHGTACAELVRSLAPACELVSVAVLGPGLRCDGEDLLAALDWALDQDFTVVNVSMSTQRDELRERLRRRCDRAFFRGAPVIVAAAHNRPVDSVPWQYPSVISVGSHDVDDAEYLEANPEPPVDFFARGRAGTDTPSMYGNSFAAAHVSGLCARVLGAHPGLAAAHVRTVLTAVADNIHFGDGHRASR